MTEILAVPRGDGREQPAHGVSIGEAFRVWLRVAALSFGGPAGQIAVMHRILVEEKKWVSESRFLHALNYCMLLPGPEAQQLATYIGWLMHRTRGGIMAGGLFILPGIVALMALSIVYAEWGQVGFVAAAFFGLKAAVLAVVVEALIRVGRRSLKSRPMQALAAAAFVAIFFFAVPFPLIIIAAGLIGFFRARAGDPAFTGGIGHGKREERAARRQPARRGQSRPYAAFNRAHDPRRRCLACAMAPARRGRGGRRRARQRVHVDRRLLQQDGDGHLRRGLRCAGLCRAAGGQRLSLGHPRRNARRPRHGGNDARPADHGAAIRGLHGGLPRARHVAAAAGRRSRRTARDLGDLHAVLSHGYSSALPTSNSFAATKLCPARCPRSRRRSWA